MSTGLGFSNAQGLTAESFPRIRKYFYVLILIVGACLTDSPSGKEQLLVAIPAILAFEISILIDRFRSK